MLVNAAATTWQDPSREVEYDIGGSNDIIDPSGNSLVDPSANQIIDTGVVADYMPATSWSQDDSE